ncbi:MAG TPA: hypothetical protein VMH90_00470 [Thermoplasmata archaeon]|nr:hypothetical protein [Thermoplasmata archaeon]
MAQKMLGKSWLAAGAVVVLIGVLLGGSAFAASPHATTYTVTFTEVGLAKGTSWSVTFNSLTTSSTGTKITFKSVAAGTNYYWTSSDPISAGSGIQYVTGQYYGYMTVPHQTGQVVAYTEQFQVTIQPSSSLGFVTPSGTYWFPAGSQYPIVASVCNGCGFTSWTATAGTATFANSSSPSTLATIKGTGAITANFVGLGTKVTFSEVGLPAGTAWSLNFGGTLYNSTTSTISISKVHPAYYNYYSEIVQISPTVRYHAPAPYYGSGTIYVPWTTSVTLVYEKQFLVNFTNPTGWASYLTSNQWVTNGSTIPIDAVGSSLSHAFSGWSSSSPAVTIANKNLDGTSAKVKGPATLSASYGNTSLCSICSLTISEVGLAPGTSWGVWISNGSSPNSVFYGTSTSSVTLKGLGATYYYWSVSNPLLTATAGVGYTTTQSSGYLYVPYELHHSIVFSPSYAVSFVSSPNYLTVGIPGGTYATYFPAGSVLPIYEQASDYFAFHKWSSSSKSVKVASAKGLSTVITVNGPATITANFQAVLDNLVFHVVGVAPGTTWGVTFNGQAYYSSGSELNITHVIAGDYGWQPINYLSTGTTGEAYVTVNPYTGVYTPYAQELTVLYEKAYLVTITTSGKAGGSVSPSGSAYYVAGTILPVSAINGTSANFSAWNSSASGLSLHSADQATYVTVGAPGTVAAKFV